MVQHIERLFLKIFEATSYILKKTGIYTLVRLLNKKKVIILMYHGITRQNNPVANYDDKHISVEKFIMHLDYLKKYYSFISLDDYFRWIQGEIKELPDNPIILTFDDGYKNNYTVLLPFLKKYSIPATIYLPTAMINTKRVAWYDIIPFIIAKTTKQKIIIHQKTYSLENNQEKISVIHLLKKELYSLQGMNQKKRFLFEIQKQTEVDTIHCFDEDFLFMSWEDCKKMQKQGIIFESHGTNHLNLIECDTDTLSQEILDSKKLLTSQLGYCHHFSYAFGRYNTPATEMVKSNYATAVTIHHGWNNRKTNPYLLKRIPITNRVSYRIFILYLFCNFPLFHHWLLKKYSCFRKALF